MISKVFSAIPYGYDGRIITVEGDSNRGLPAFNLVGMANKTVTEARERVRSAITNSGFNFPTRKITINLAPAELAKDGAHLDLPIAVAVLSLAGKLHQTQLDQKLFVGELSLNGQTKPIRGIINIVEIAKQSGFTAVYLPKENLHQAQLVTDVNLVGISSLLELFAHLSGIHLTKITSSASSPPSTVVTTHPQPQSQSPILLDHIYGQSSAKRALKIAIAGRHNILLTGPPGTGKTLLARAATNLLPKPSPSEQIEIAKIHALSTSPEFDFRTRPFRSPHHTASPAAILGGGLKLQPGEVSLAHCGVLFLDELPEFSRNVLESLRQPLEDGHITLARANYHTTYPANFMLIATMNPCPCGYYGDPNHPCTCSPVQIQNYRNRLSGPILDRFDLFITVDRIENYSLLSPNLDPSSNTISEHTQSTQDILRAAKLQHQRYQNEQFFNSDLTSSQFNNFIHLPSATLKFLQVASQKLHISTRSYFKLLKVAQTIADLDQEHTITPSHISEALSYRFRSTNET